MALNDKRANRNWLALGLDTFSYKYRLEDSQYRVAAGREASPQRVSGGGEGVGGCCCVLLAPAAWQRTTRPSPPPLTHTVRRVVAPRPVLSVPPSPRLSLRCRLRFLRSSPPFLVRRRRRLDGGGAPVTPPLSLTATGVCVLPRWQAQAPLGDVPSPPPVPFLPPLLFFARDAVYWLGSLVFFVGGAAVFGRRVPLATIRGGFLPSTLLGKVV